MVDTDCGLAIFHPFTIGWRVDRDIQALTGNLNRTYSHVSLLGWHSFHVLRPINTLQCSGIVEEFGVVMLNL